MKILRTLPFVVAAVVVAACSMLLPPSVLWVAGLLLTLVAAAVSVLGYANLPAVWGWPVPAETPRRHRRRLIIIGLSLAVIASTVALHWPLRACFWLSRPALERLAQQARRVPLKMPQNAGFFTIQEIDFNKHEAVLWLGGDGGEPTILVRQSPGNAPRKNGSDRIDLDSQWYFYSEM